MITAKSFASLGSVWHIAVPSLEQFTRWVNLNTKPYSWYVRRYGEASRSSLIAETAFERLANASEADNEAERRARASLQSVAGAPRGGALDSSENFEVSQLVRNLEKALMPSYRNLTYHPIFPGCGLVDRAVGDALGDGHLFEIKAVDRGFRGIDFRQALTYAALAYASGTHISRISLINPRRAIMYEANTSGLAVDLGATSWIDLMQNLVDAMTEVGPSQ